MKAVCSVILKSNGSYNNTELVNGVEYTVNVSIDNVESINRTAEVVTAPFNSGLNPGDEVIVHHNIMRENIHVDGKKRKSHFHIANDYYECPVSEVLMKRDKEGKWITLLDFVFLRPIKEEDIKLDHGLVLSPYSRKGMKDLRAVLAITNKKLKGVEVGEVVVFSRNSEHEFLIDGVKMFKCEVCDILGKL